jgi:hypothetical protein
MPRSARKTVLLTCILLAAVLVAVVLVTLPPRARPVTASPANRGTILRGAYHIHTTRSDGSGSIEEVAAAAARAGLQFIVLTDHGDGTRPPLPPAYHSGVLVVDGVEISTRAGHYVALGLPETPYRLAGEPRDVVEDVTRLGGFGIAAHPDSPKRELRWEQWDLPFDGVEWVNIDTEWRDESRTRLVRAFAHYWLRPAETLASLLDHSRDVVDRWDRLAARRRVAGFAAIDAHARFGLRGDAEAYDPGLQLRVPSYVVAFRLFTLRVELDAKPDGHPQRDADHLLRAIRGGRFYNAIDGLANGGDLRLSASSGSATARMGEFLPPQGDVTWDAASSAPAGASLRLVCDGRVVAETPATERLRLTQASGSLPAACRTEVGWRERGTSILWLVSNPIYLRASDAVIRTNVASTEPIAMETPGDPVRGAAWHIEHDTSSHGALTTTGSRLDQETTFTYTLGGGQRAGQYAALVTSDVEALPGFARLAFDAQADRPLRLSVQLRQPVGEHDAHRWRRSIYLDPTPRTVTIPFLEFRPVESGAAEKPALGGVQSLMFVVDSEHSRPGDTGRVRLHRLRFER